MSASLTLLGRPKPLIFSTGEPVRIPVMGPLQRPGQAAGPLARGLMDWQARPSWETSFWDHRGTKRELSSPPSGASLSQVPP